MWSVRKLFVFFCFALLFAGCGSGSGATGGDMPHSTLGQPIVITSHKFTPPGYPWDVIVVIMQQPSTPPPPENPGSGNQVIDEGNAPPADPETPPAPTSHVLVTGSLVHSAYAEGDFLVEARPSIACGEAQCPNLTAKPVASVKVTKPGYFALVMPLTDKEVFVVASYTHPTEGTSTREHSLGVVSERVNGVVLDFSPEPPADEPGDETLSPEAIEALGDLFREAEEAQESLNDMIGDALSGLSI